ncbi:MAG: hypothetical protein JNK87_08370 [Bryobacterales bacterium]|nr:hypothetical protein [Bryobacterales bacterium]
MPETPGNLAAPGSHVVWLPAALVTAIAAAATASALLQSGRYASAILIAALIGIGLRYFLQLFLEQRSWALTADGIVGMGIVSGTLPWRSVQDVSLSPFGLWITTANGRSRIPIQDVDIRPFSPDPKIRRQELLQLLESWWGQTPSEDPVRLRALIAPVVAALLRLSATWFLLSSFQYWVNEIAGIPPEWQRATYLCSLLAIGPALFPVRGCLAATLLFWAFSLSISFPTIPAFFRYEQRGNVSPVRRRRRHAANRHPTRPPRRRRPAPTSLIPRLLPQPKLPIQPLQPRLCRTPRMNHHPVPKP